MDRNGFQISFGDLCIEFTGDFPIEPSVEFRPFLTEGRAVTDRYRVEVITQPLSPCGELLYRDPRLSAYREEEGTLLVYSSMGGYGIPPGSLVGYDGNHRLYVSPALADSMKRGIRLSGIMNGEELLLHRGGLVLHCSVVSHGGKGILFSGPSGIGKSTQAALWQQVFGDKILNGDRGVLRGWEDGFTVGGSPWCGSSGIYSPETVAVSAIVLLRQGKENRICPVEPKVAFREIYSQCIVHGWDRSFVDGVCDLIRELLDRVPVYVLSCRADRDAVMLTEKVVFGSR